MPLPTATVLPSILISYGYLAQAFAYNPMGTHALLVLHEGQPLSCASEKFVEPRKSSSANANCTQIREAPRKVMSGPSTRKKEFAAVIEFNTLLPGNISRIEVIILHLRIGLIVGPMIVVEPINCTHNTS